jgi:hypothetical protein
MLCEEMQGVQSPGAGRHHGRGMKHASLERTEDERAG